MPFINIMTNVDCQQVDEVIEAIAKVSAKATGKSTKSTLVNLQLNQCIWFANSMEPAAMVNVEAVRVSDELTQQFVDCLTAEIAQHLHISLERIYINIAEFTPQRWALAGKLLG